MGKGRQNYGDSFKSLFFLFLVIALISSCGTDELTPDYKGLTVQGFIQQDPNFSILAEIFEQTGIGDTLNGYGTFTLIAPTNKAFEEAGITSASDLSSEDLDSLINYHLASGKLNSEDLIGEVKETFLQGYYWLINKEENEIIVNGDVSLLVKDIEVSNGMVHGIGSVLEASKLNVVSMAQSQGYTLFVKGLLQTGLDKVLTETGPFTLFIPTDAAFAAYFEANGITEEEWLSASRLDAFMEYCIVEGSLESDELVSDALISYGGDSLFVSKKEEEIWLNGNALITRKDIQGGNGIIHEQDKVITVPERSLATIVSEGSQNQGYEEFKAALIYAGLLSELEQQEGPLTVFVPNNLAFYAWYESLGVSGYYEIEETVLVETLMYHIAIGRVFSQSFQTGQVLETKLADKTLLLDGEGPTVNGISLDENYLNQLGTNGLIHGVGEVLIPE
ncbi:fasciclin domain-containing protein [Echinicola sp. 20G]|uniref:fasciclin domain-containing protein n=1 Tax=Echinicola sp. 20G TaxID=2781961 RepID=UPI0019101736|nr:fasciclin domain-containing protein [Echinicola sp. 20G]